MLPIRDTIPGRNPPIGTWLVILANSVGFLFELMMPRPSVRNRASPLYPSRLGLAGRLSARRLLAVLDEHVSGPASSMRLSRIIGRVNVDDLPRADAAKLEHCLASRPREMGHLRGHGTIGSRGQSLRGGRVESVPRSEIERARDDGQSLDLWMPMWCDTVAIWQ